MTEPASAESATSKPGSTTKLTDAKVEVLLEQLRNKNSSFRGTQDSWNEFAKQIRRAALVSDVYNLLPNALFFPTTYEHQIVSI